MEVVCGACGERERLRGAREGGGIRVTCESCGWAWDRDLARSCPTCQGDDIQIVPLAIVEKGRGTQLSVVGTRPLHLCTSCDAETLRRYHDHRPNPLMPAELPTVPPRDDPAVTDRP